METTLISKRVADDGASTCRIVPNPKHDWSFTVTNSHQGNSCAHCCSARPPSEKNLILKRRESLDASLMWANAFDEIQFLVTRSQIKPQIYPLPLFCRQRKRLQHIHFPFNNSKASSKGSTAVFSASLRRTAGRQLPGS